MAARDGALIDQACRQTGLSEFGGDGFREGLSILVRALDEEARLTPMGAAVMDGTIVNLLSCRLQVEDWYVRHPEIDEQQIVDPLIGLGLPRTGSSALGNILGEDPAVRSIRSWESQAPCPPPEAATQHTDPRIAAAAESLRQQDAMFPRFKAMLPNSPTAPSECQNFMGYEFKSQLFMAFGRVPSYAHWLLHEAAMVPAYAYVKRVLKLLQWRCPPRSWQLRSPSHCLFIGALDKVFPDARFWMTHRDIASVVPSVCDLYSELYQALSERIDVLEIGRQNTDWTELGQRRVMAFRDGQGQDRRFHDIQFQDFQADPIGEVDRLYAFLGKTLSNEARGRMAAWWRDTPREKPAGQGYEAATFGLDKAALRQRFRFYTGRYGVKLNEAAPA